MRSYEVAREQWATFLDSFSQDHQGWFAAIETHQPGQIPERKADGVPLRQIAFRSDAQQGSAISILAGGDASGGDGALAESVNHSIGLPRLLRFACSSYWPDAALEIQPADGPTTLLHVWRKLP